VNSDDELLDLVDAQDHVIGTIRYADVRGATSLTDHFIRAASCFIRNSEGKLWIPKRTADKQIAPNGLDYSAGGHVQSGESYIAGMIRELAEETGIKASEHDLEYIGKLSPTEAVPYYYFGAIYLYNSNITPDYNPHDFVGFEWLDPTELRQRLLGGVPAKDSLLPSVDMLLAYVAQH
jgi:isopentenyldiphosphate isomerase